MSGDTGAALAEAIDRLGFYPELVKDAVHDGLVGLTPSAHLVQLETHFDNGEIHRHITVLALAGKFLLVAHLDDSQLDEAGEVVVAHVNVETLPVSAITSMQLNYSYPQPQDYTPASTPSEISLVISWTGGLRLDLQPADCPDPTCSADHGYTGVAPREDVVLRISSTADGADLVQEARAFARALRAVQLGLHAGE